MNLSEIDSPKGPIKCAYHVTPISNVKYCLDGSFGHGIFRWTNLDVKCSIDSLPCKVTVLIIAVFLYFI